MTPILDKQAALKLSEYLLGTPQEMKATLNAMRADEWLRQMQHDNCADGLDVWDVVAGKMRLNEMLGVVLVA